MTSVTRKPKRTRKPSVKRAAPAPRTLRSAVAAVDAVPLPVPIIVVPGNPASNLLDLYPTTPDSTYTLSRGGWPFHKPSADKNYDRLPFHPDDPATTLNTTGKSIAPARIAAINAFYIPYEDLVERLKSDVGTQDQPAPVFPFAYDWRFDTAVSAIALSDFITEVLRIMSRVPTYRNAPPDKVDIVAHSFGGLVTARYLRACQKQRPVRDSRVRKVVTIASPFRGAVDAVHSMIKDLDQREAARTLPSVYGLLPYFENATVDATKNPPPPLDLLTDPSIWDGSSVERSVDNYCRRMGSTKTGSERLTELRAAANAQRADLTALDVTAALGSADNWLPIIGVGSKSNTQVQVVRSPPNAEFALVQKNEGDSTGDNTVPFLGAIPSFNLATGAPSSPTPRERLVCLTEDDIGLHERGDWLGLGQMLGLASLHSFLPRMDAVQQIVIGFLRVNAPKFKAKARPAPGVSPLNVNWPPSWGVAP
jgi:pimeloyl-ACP methyl ester carboxylesterase